jgi:hypothetical protein
MYTPGLLLLGVLVLVALSRREHLTFTSTLKDIRGMSDQAEIDRVYALAPASLKSLATNSPAPNPLTTGEKAKNLVALLVSEFQRGLYIPATTPITEAALDAWIATTLQAAATRDETPVLSFMKTALSNGDAKRLYMAYLGLTSSTTTPPINPPPASSTTTPTSIPQALQYLQDNLLEYKMTGNDTYKTAYDGTKRWIDSYIASLNTQLARDADGISSQITSYESATPDLAKSQADFQAVKANGPKVEDTYLTIKKQMDHHTGAGAPSDSGSYVKGAIAAGLGLGALALVFV